jgi:hypothetical protein
LCNLVLSNKIEITIMIRTIIAAIKIDEQNLQDENRTKKKTIW